MRKHGIRSKLFISYTLIVSFVIAILSLFFYIRMSSVVWERSLETSRQMLQRVDASLSQAIKDIDRISAQVIYNSDFQHKFEESFSTVETYEDFDQKNAFVKILATLNGPSFIAQQINVFNLDGDFISYGLKIDPYDNLKERISLLDWVTPTLKKDGDKQINPPHRDELFKSGELVFSLSRLFPHSSASSPKFVEVQQSYEKLKEIAGDALLQTNNQLYIFDDEGHLFYPIEDDKLIPPFEWSDIPHLPSGVFHNVTEKVNGESMVIGWLRSSFSGLTVVAAQPKQQLLSPVNSLRSIVLTVMIAAEIFALLIAYWIASSITRPIRLILKDVKRLDLEQINLNMMVQNQKTYRKATYEIQELYDGVVSMKTRLNNSVDQFIDSQKRENLAHMRALHNQLQPHFVFNTLSSIGALAENSGADQAAAMSYKMMHLMEYISQPNTDPVQMQEELNFTESYLQLMKLRYQDNFSYEVEVTETLSGIIFPKVVLQPIVENSFTHGFRSVNPPWHIGIKVTESNNEQWAIRITDNGSGFQIEALQRIKRFIENLNDGLSSQPDLIGSKGIGGIGLENALMRLYLFYQGKVSFDIHNLEEGMELTIKVGLKEGMPDV
ncbi:sensor histidine kinase [Cohnella sp. WQ 127256]|uniref:cache domain-containing sensor histidine kinase n=1 Tax=Cohnella sp. WQ 127256 TaxID=2938790 RepID=UPI0021175774|nr:sensor histidine kinase [Cohnella sp. WQ 127256]